MTKETFLEFLGELVNNADVYTSGDLDEKEAKSFSDHLSDMMDLYESKKEKGITEKGQTILTWMQENKEECDNTFIASDIAKGIDMTGRQVSGSIRSLVTMGIVTKKGKNPVIYSLAE